MSEKIRITIGMLSAFVMISRKSWFLDPTRKNSATSAARLPMTAGFVNVLSFHRKSAKNVVASVM